MKKIILTATIFFTLITLINAQSTTKIKGTVSDAVTGDKLAFVSISIPGSQQGTITDYEGMFFIETKTKFDSLIFNCYGYKTESIAIKRGIFQEINLKLKPESFKIDEVVVHAGVNPAHTLFRKIMKHKRINNPQKFNSFSYELYTKTELDINNFDTKLQDKKAMKQFKFVFDHIDTSAATGKVYLPVLISETLSDYYFRRSPKKEKEIIRAVNISGVENKSAMQFTGQMYLDVNIYDNYVNIMEKQFVSPIAINGLLVYDYYLIDSMTIDNSWCYQLSFKPRRQQEYTFKGDMWIADTTFAVKEITARISPGVNINFVKDLYFKQKFTLLEDSLWFPYKDEMFVDFNLTDMTAGFFGRKTTTREKINLKPNFSDDFFSSTASKELIVKDEATNPDTAFWNNSRHEKLTVKEQGIYDMVDSVKNVPVFRTMTDVVMMLTMGYYPMGWFEYGPYFKTYSFNEIEGNRFRIGGRTSSDFSKKIEFNGHIAYGTKDNKFKYGAGVKYKLKKNPWTVASAKYTSDMIQLGLSPNAFTEDNVLATILSRSTNNKMLMQQRLNVNLEKEWFQGYMNSISFSQRLIYPSTNISFYDKDSIAFPNLAITELMLGFHFAYNEKYLDGDFTRVYLGSAYPVIDINYTYGPKGTFNSQYEFHKIQVNWSHYFFLGPIGKFQYGIEGGKIWGKVPFPLLKLHEGNQTYVFDPYSFNMMNFYEFASDEYVSIYAEHHFQGLFLNKIPILRKLKMREVLYGKGVIGSLKTENRDEFQFPGTLSDVGKPYFEAGVGIENILNFFRVDGIWRLSYLDNPNIQKFGIRVSIHVMF